MSDDDGARSGPLCARARACYDSCARGPIVFSEFQFSETRPSTKTNVRDAQVPIRPLFLFHANRAAPGMQISRTRARAGYDECREMRFEREIGLPARFFFYVRLKT